MTSPHHFVETPTNPGPPPRQPPRHVPVAQDVQQAVNSAFELTSDAVSASVAVKMSNSARQTVLQQYLGGGWVGGYIPPNVRSAISKISALFGLWCLWLLDGWLACEYEERRCGRVGLRLKKLKQLQQVWARFVGNVLFYHPDWLFAWIVSITSLYPLLKFLLDLNMPFTSHDSRQIRKSTHGLSLGVLLVEETR